MANEPRGIAAGSRDPTLAYPTKRSGRFRVRRTALKNQRSTYWFWAADHEDRVG
jgi:hypothetical protein